MTKVFVEVHQNGELLSKTSRPFQRRGSIELTSDPDGELTAPFYPLPTTIRILKITQRGVEVDLDPNWEGFTTCEGKIEDINSNRKSAYTHIMKKGDYGSIAYNDLRVLIRIGKERQSPYKVIKQSQEYKGRLSELWLGERREIKFVALGFLASCWLTGGFVMGLMLHPDDRPATFIDLRNEYTLPFIHPSHLRSAPESMQTSYDRVAPLRSVLSFIHGMTDTLLGFEPLDTGKASEKLIYAETRNRYKSLHIQHDNDLKNLNLQREGIEGEVLKDKRNALVAIPIIQGESFAGSLLRLEDKLAIWYENTDQSLKLRRLTSESFRQDPLYDFAEYKDTKKQVRIKVAEGADPRDEKALYKEADRLATQAAVQRERIIQRRAPQVPLSVKNSAPLALPLTNAFASSVTVENFSAFNQKLGLIQASLFNPDKPKVIREPLIGTLDPHLIQQTVERYRFELQLCYELALRRNQQAAGSMEWQWHLDTQGQVFDIELLQSSIVDTKMVDCVRGKLASWKWPRPQKGSIQISFPFHFRPAKG